MEGFWNDLRFGLRALRKTPALTLIAVLTLALGIGASTAIFSVVQGVILRPLGFAEEDRLFALLARHEIEGNEHRGLSLPDFWYLREHQTSFEALTFYGWQTLTLEQPDHVEQLLGVYVDQDTFQMLGLEPLHGRSFVPEDIIPGRSPVALLSFELWQRRWGGDEQIVGQTIRIDGEPVVILGVMPAATELPAPHAELWIPVGYLEDRHGRFSREERDFTVLGRLPIGVERQAAQAEIDQLAAQIAAASPGISEGWGIAVEPLREHLVGAARRPIVVAFVAVVLVLLIACTNIAHLLMVRAAARQRELAVRAALGADRRQLARQLLTESLVLASAGGILGVLVAAWLQDVLLLFDPGILPRSHAIGLDLQVLVFALAATLATGFACGLIPALRGSLGPIAGLKEGGDRATTGHPQGRWRLTLLGGEIALALVLLTAAGLLLQALLSLERIDPGFQPANTYSAHILLDKNVYSTLAARRDYFDRLRDKIAVLPGIEAVGLTTTPPVPGMGIQMDVPYRGGDGQPLTGATLATASQASLRVISPGYLDTVGLALLGGRDFGDEDLETAPRVVLVNHTLARRLWPSQDPVGQRLQVYLYGETLDWQVIGVVGDTRSAGRHLPPRPAIFFHHPQLPFLGMAVVARTRLPPAVYASILERTVLELDPHQPFNSVQSLERRLASTLGVERFFATVLSLFAVLALVLAAAGIYGVFSYWVGQRTREIGLRMALGARAGQVVWLILGQGLAILGAGLAVGIVGALLVAQLLAKTFRGVAVTDFAVLVGVATLLAATALLACLLPARRASRTEPTVALKVE